MRGGGGSGRARDNKYKSAPAANAADISALMLTTRNRCKHRASEFRSRNRDGGREPRLVREVPPLFFFVFCFASTSARSLR